jgi:hypothetical protein
MDFDSSEPKNLPPIPPDDSENESEYALIGILVSICMFLMEVDTLLGVEKKQEQEQNRTRIRIIIIIMMNRIRHRSRVTWNTRGYGR